MQSALHILVFQSIIILVQFRIAGRVYFDKRLVVILAASKHLLWLLQGTEVCQRVAVCDEQVGALAHLYAAGHIPKAQNTSVV